MFANSNTLGIMGPTRQRTASDTVINFDNVTPQKSASQQVSAGTLSYEEAQEIKQAAVILFKRLIEILRVKQLLLEETIYTASNVLNATMNEISFRVDSL
ncbi:9568_t:CDS:2, partial [Paraglomus occultum]